MKPGPWFVAVVLDVRRVAWGMRQRGAFGHVSEIDNADDASSDPPTFGGLRCRSGIGENV